MAEKPVQDLQITEEDDLTKEANSLVSDEEEVFLFDPAIIERIDLSRVEGLLKGKTAQNPGENLKIRPLSTGDYDRGFLKLLEQLTKVGDVSRAEFLKRFHFMKTRNDTYFVTVIEDTAKNQVIGCATLVNERKFIRNCASRGIVEDVVVSSDYRGQSLGQLITCVVAELAVVLGCYKVSLNCEDGKIGWYERMGFKAEEGNANFLAMRVPQNMK